MDGFISSAIRLSASLTLHVESVHIRRWMSESPMGRFTVSTTSELRLKLASSIYTFHELYNVTFGQLPLYFKLSVAHITRFLLLPSQHVNQDVSHGCPGHHGRGSPSVQPDTLDLNLNLTRQRNAMERDVAYQRHACRPKSNSMYNGSPHVQDFASRVQRQA